MSKKRQNITYGVHPVLEALEAGQSIDKIFVRQGSNHARIAEIRQIAGSLQIPVQMVPDAKIERLSGQEANHQGVVAVMAAISYQGLEEVILSTQEKGEVPLFILLDGVTDVRNFGAIARTAECLGANGIIIGTQGAASANADAVKVSAGALHHIPVCREKNLVDSLMMLQAYEIRTIGATEKAQESIYEQNLKEAVCIIMGSEEKGISKQLLKRVDVLAKVPLSGQVASLNVSVAAGMFLSEAVRQRQS